MKWRSRILFFLADVLFWIIFTLSGIAWFVCAGDMTAWLFQSRPEPFLISPWLEVPYFFAGLLLTFAYSFHKTVE